MPIPPRKRMPWKIMIMIFLFLRFSKFIDILVLSQYVNIHTSIHWSPDCKCNNRKFRCIFLRNLHVHNKSTHLATNKVDAGYMVRFYDPFTIKPINFNTVVGRKQSDNLSNLIYDTWYIKFWDNSYSSDSSKFNDISNIFWGVRQGGMIRPLWTIKNMN